MKTRAILATIMVALLISASGCPRAPAISLGVWLITINGTTMVGLEFGAGGMVQNADPIPPEANGSFSGMQSWAQNRSTFTMTSEVGGAVFVYTGTVDSSTSIIDGTWIQTVAGSSTGTWNARKL